jgi:hypothetical protein
VVGLVKGRAALSVPKIFENADRAALGTIHKRLAYEPITWLRC